MESKEGKSQIMPEVTGTLDIDQRLRFSRQIIDLSCSSKPWRIAAIFLRAVFPEMF